MTNVYKLTYEWEKPGRRQEHELFFTSHKKAIKALREGITNFDNAIHFDSEGGITWFNGRGLSAKDENKIIRPVAIKKTELNKGLG